MKDCYVYFIANWTHEVLYIGVTNNLERRIQEHKSGLVPGFTSTYNLSKLLHYEYFTDITTAIEREKQLKNWRRDKKDALIAKHNPTWDDLSDFK